MAGRGKDLKESRLALEKFESDLDDLKDPYFRKNPSKEFPSLMACIPGFIVSRSKSRGSTENPAIAAKSMVLDAVMCCTPAAICLQKEVLLRALHFFPTAFCQAQFGLVTG